MWRMEYKNIISLILSIFCFSWLFTQEFSELYTLYDQKNFHELKEKIQSYEKKHRDNIEIQFFKTLFNKNGDEAVDKYKELLDRADGRLKDYLLEKIAEYYYSKGFYITASKYRDSKTNYPEKEQNTGLERKNDPEINHLVKTDTPKFRIQVGAFSLRENANTIKEKLQSHAINAVIVERTVNKKNLFCVWINGKNNFEDTKEYAEMIKKKLNLDYRILKP